MSGVERLHWVACGQRSRLWWAVSCTICVFRYTLLHKTAALTITYGADLINVFNRIVQFASKTTGWPGLQPASVLLALVSIQTAIGITAGLAGWYFGRRTRNMYLESSLEVAPREKNLFQYGHRRRELMTRLGNTCG